MPQTSLSITEKEKVKSIIDNKIGPTQPINNRRKDWRVNAEGNLMYFVTFSKSNQLFYDINLNDLKDWLSYPFAFVVFVMGSHEHPLIIPVKKLQEYIADLSPKGNSEIKLHIKNSIDGYTFLEAPNIDLTIFYKNYSQLIPNEINAQDIVLSDLKAFEFEEEFFEGEKHQRLTNFYERNLELRTAAIIVHGTDCMVCGFNFEKAYGEHGIGFIEVHHIQPVNSLNGSTQIDPEADMSVLCSNCHRMIHRNKNNPLSLEELREILFHKE